jgi:hypothetical protein
MMAKYAPVVTGMAVNYVAPVGVSVHLHTDAGEMDVTVTTDQYGSLRAQLAQNGHAIIPTATVVAA